MKWTAASWVVILGVCSFQVPVSADATADRVGADRSPDGGGRTVSFVNDVVPVLTKAGCNSGACHAKAPSGQNGFRLSLLGFEPAEDHEHIVEESRGRRVSPSFPEASLILAKASARVPHGGGRRLAQDSEGYDVIARWIAQGAVFGPPGEPSLIGVDVTPAEVVLAPGGSVRFEAVARYSDGSARDVSERALFETNDRSRLSVDADGTATSRGLPGRAAVMVRYQGTVSVSEVILPVAHDASPPGVANSSQEGEGSPDPHGDRVSFIDRLVFENLSRIGLTPAGPCDDATFLRRVSLDVCGTLPSVEETRRFLLDTSSDKRERLVDDLLSRSEYADFFAGKWTSILKNRRDDSADLLPNFTFHAWVRDGLLANKPYDRFVRELLAATGDVSMSPPVAWYKRVKDPKQQTEDVAQLFLGVRIQCAQCHHHPFERWSQDDYHALVAFFSRVGRKPSGVRGEDLIFHKRGRASFVNPRSGRELLPAALGSDPGTIQADDDPRLRLADWMARPDNPFFARALVNRYWKHFLGRGLVEPEDDLRETNPPTNPALLSALARDFVDGGFDLRRLVRQIVTSRTYQLASRAAAGEEGVGGSTVSARDDQNYASFEARRLPAEVLLDAVDRASGSMTSFANLPAGTRAIALPDNSYNVGSPFLKVFGRPDNASVCECERADSPSLAQSLHLINDPGIRGKLSASGGRAAVLAARDCPDSERIHEIYLACLSREPRPDELLVAERYLVAGLTKAGASDAAASRRERLEDVLWAVITSKEFLFNH